ncbi:hypothetical protein [Nannocystis pusilla]|uniref:Uncharacterized protein n=1 Tax=Nannocystis pusilla TaxID=889268 RepID=A0ABS7TWD2_9BACT|nr:hypothetical protein [Nannocystis pusilla]MBZ5712504.1 hypothetical protein [Nannocystis pusilla]
MRLAAPAALPAPARLGATASLVLSLACGAPVVPDAPPRPSGDSPPAQESPQNTVLSAIDTPRDDPAVHHDDFARSVLYTWTTREQIDALRASHRLLVADGDVGERSPYLRALDVLVGAGHPLAAVLRDHPRHRRRRYAWTSPLATTLGLGARRYGDALVRIDLAPDALIVAVRPRAAEPFVLVDMSGRPVDLSVAVADPGRIGAVYHVRDGPDDPVAFREYIVCNESKIAEWSVATPAIRARVDADIDLLESLRRGDLAHLPAEAVRAPAAASWASAAPRPTPLDRWHAILAFDNERYRPTPSNLAAVAEALRGYDPAGAPLVHRPAVAFPADQLASHAAQ